LMWDVCLMEVLPMFQKAWTYQALGGQGWTWLRHPVGAPKRQGNRAPRSGRFPRIERTGRAPDLIQRRTVRVETRMASATSVIVKKRDEVAGIVAFLAGMSRHPQKAKQRRHLDQSACTDFRPFDLAGLHLVVDHRATQAGCRDGVIDRASRPFGERYALRLSRRGLVGR
jgi:hypothetical protein